MAGKIIQAGVIPYRKRGKKVEILLVTRRRSGKWFIPKGNIERDLSAVESARKEAKEEAGALGKAKDKKLGDVITTKRGKKVQVKVFPMRVTDLKSHWREDDERKRRWFSAKEARKRLDENDLAQIIGKLDRSL